MTATTSACGGSDARGDDRDVLPRVVEDDLRREQRVDDPVALTDAHPGRQPAEDAAERDEPDAVTALEVAGGERRGRAYGQIEGRAPARARVGERVEEEDHVGVPLGMALVDDEHVAPGARPPVDRADAVARRELAQVGELEPFALLPRDLVARERLRRDGCDDPAQRLRERVDAQARPPVEPCLPGEQPEAVSCPQPDVADLVVPPPGAAEPQLRSSVRPPSRAAARARARPRRARALRAGRAGARAARSAAPRRRRAPARARPARARSPARA